MPFTRMDTKWRALRIFTAAIATCALACGNVGAKAAAQAPVPAGATAEFTQLAAQLVAAREAAGPESEAAEERALAILDGVALEGLNRPSPDVAALNQRLAGLVKQQPSEGETYSVAQLKGSPGAYALLADFGLGGPSAVRIYAGAPGKLALAGHVDRYAQKDFIDDYIELLPLETPISLFATIAGRTDELQTGVFTIWRFDGRAVQAIWSSDILQQSSYRAVPNGFELTYCAQTDPDDPSACHGMERDRYAWQNGAWKQIETAKLPAPAGK